MIDREPDKTEGDQSLRAAREVLAMKANSRDSVKKESRSKTTQPQRCLESDTTLGGEREAWRMPETRASSQLHVSCQCMDHSTMLMLSPEEPARMPPALTVGLSTSTSSQPIITSMKFPIHKT